MLKSIHIVLAYLTVIGFVVRGMWSLADSPFRYGRWVKVVPHVIDSVLLVLGVVMAVRLSISPMQGWLAAKLGGLVTYIGFGVLTMRAGSTRLKAAGFVGALSSVGYIFAVAFARDPSPW